MAIFDVLFRYEWELTKSPAGAQQWTPKKDSGAPMAPNASDLSKSVPLMMDNSRYGNENGSSL